MASQEHNHNLLTHSHDYAFQEEEDRHGKEAPCPRPRNTFSVRGLKLSTASSEAPPAPRISLR